MKEALDKKTEFSDIESFFLLYTLCQNALLKSNYNGVFALLCYDNYLISLSETSCSTTFLQARHTVSGKGKPTQCFQKKTHKATGHDWEKVICGSLLHNQA